MGTRLLVTIGTDGTTNWVQMPDGRKFNLGAVSVLKFVTKLALRGNRSIRRALKSFLKGEEVTIQIDGDLMWDMLAPRQTRWGTTYPFIPHDQRTSRGTTMDKISKDLDALGGHIQAMNERVGKISSEDMGRGVSILASLVDDIASKADGSYFGVQASESEDKPEEETPSQEEMEKESSSKLAFDTYQENSKLASQILDQMESVDQKIDKIVASGKKGFNSIAAKADVHEVTRKVASIVSEVDLATTPWVAADLEKLSDRAASIHRLFFPTED